MPPNFFRPKDRPLLNLGLLVLTFLTTFGTFLNTFTGGGKSGKEEAFLFSISLILVLGAHEMGHYVLARIHQVDSSLPYFIPLPYLGIGTLGAVIRIRGRIPHRNALVDIGAAGPIAGLAMAIPILIIGLRHSAVIDAPPTPHLFAGENSLWVLVPQLWHFLTGLIGSHPTASAEEAVRLPGYVFGDNLLTLLLQRWVVGSLPPGKDLAAHPMWIAGWAGLLVTMLNLAPLGQLDGGHLTFAMFGKRASQIGKAMAILMFGLCVFYSAGWLLWLIITSKVIGFGHPQVVEPAAPLSQGRRWICGICLAALVLCVMPVPISLASAP